MIPEEHLHIFDTRRTFTHLWYQKNIATFMILKEQLKNDDTGATFTH